MAWLCVLSVGLCHQGLGFTSQASVIGLWQCLFVSGPGCVRWCISGSGAVTYVNQSWSVSDLCGEWCVSGVIQVRIECPL